MIDSSSRPFTHVTHDGQIRGASGAGAPERPEVAGNGSSVGQPVPERAAGAEDEVPLPGPGDEPGPVRARAWRGTRLSGTTAPRPDGGDNPGPGRAGTRRGTATHGGPRRLPGRSVCGRGGIPP